VLFLGITVGQFTLAGLPFLAGFPVVWSLAVTLKSVSPIAAAAVLIASAGMLAGAVRSTGFLLSSAGEEVVLVLSNRFSRAVIAAGLLISLLLGGYPGMLDPLLNLISGAFLP